MKKSQRSEAAAKRGTGTKTSPEAAGIEDKSEPSTCTDGNSVNTANRIDDQDGNTELQRDLAHFIKIIATIHAERICSEPLDTES